MIEVGVIFLILWFLFFVIFVVMSLKENVVVIFGNFVMVSINVGIKIDYYGNIFEFDEILF